MSIQLMSHIWANGPESQSETLVLLALADYANDDGVCWPSINGLVKKSRLSERGVQKVLKRLCEGGWLKISYGNGRNNCNVYTIKTPNEVHPERGSPPYLSAKTPNLSAINPERGSPEPSITIKEPSLNNKRARDEVIDLLSKWSSKEAAVSFEKYRRGHKAKALTLTAAKRLSGELQEIFNAGYDPSDALGLAEERGWASVKLDWYESSQNRKKAGVKNGSYENDSDPEFLRIVTAAARGTTRPDRR
jgi:hypothetical protein